MNGVAMNIVETILYDDDVYECDSELASDILNELAEDAYYYVYENDNLRSEFDDMNDDINHTSIGEFIWYCHWNDFIDYIRNKYRNVTW